MGKFFQVVLMTLLIMFFGIQIVELKQERSMHQQETPQLEQACELSIIDTSVSIIASMQQSTVKDINYIELKLGSDDNNSLLYTKANNKVLINKEGEVVGAIPNCLECHTTKYDKLADDRNSFTKNEEGQVNRFIRCRSKLHLTTPITE